jgi:hypothetical protein
MGIGGEPRLLFSLDIEGVMPFLGDEIQGL